MTGQTRREFLAKTVSGAAAVGTGLGMEGAASLAKSKEIPRRTLGKTGESVSAICLGGYHIGVQKDPAESIRIIDAAIDRGIDFMDNSDDYLEGESEIRMGRAIQGKRDRVFLMTKPHPRDKKGALKSLEESLRRLRTDRIDLWQFHEIVYETDPDWIFSPNGAIEAAYIAKKQGKVRYVGFTGHYRPEYHLKMLSKPYEWDSVQLPLNVFDYHYRSFQKQVLPVLLERKIGVIGMKALASGYVAKSKVVTPIEALHYALNLPTSTVVVGCDSMAFLDQAIQAAAIFEPMTENQVATLLERVRPVALSGENEPFKSTTAYNNPQVAPPPYES